MYEKPVNNKQNKNTTNDNCDLNDASGRLLGNRERVPYGRLSIPLDFASPILVGIN